MNLRDKCERRVALAHACVYRRGSGAERLCAGAQYAVHAYRRELKRWPAEPRPSTNTEGAIP